MSTETTWKEELSNKIEEMLSDPKQVKFNTHRNRKGFTNKLISTVLEYVNKYTEDKQKGKDNRSGMGITHLHTEKPKGSVVMTQELAQKSDDLRFQAKNKGVRSW